MEAGRDSCIRRRADDPGGGAGEVVDVHIVPLEMYDSARAKIDANFRWLFAKAFGKDHIPEDLRDPFYTDQYEQEHIKPPVIRLLLSGELYCRVCGLIILQGEQAAALHGHRAVIQALSRRGFYVLRGDGTPVSDEDLGSAPIKMSSHIPLIDALMMAFTAEMMSIERVVSSVKRFSSFSASKELPFDLEDAMVFWINKVNMKMREITDKELKMKNQLMGSPVPIHHKVRYRREHLSGRTLYHFPLVDDLVKDVCDGTALLAVVHFYCPAIVRLEDICLKEVPSITDCLYNIQLLREFSNEYLNKSFYLKPEDMLYSPPVLKNNLMVFVAELFWWFEIVKPDFVQPRDLQEIIDVRSLLQPKSSSRPHLPISNATKRSFLPSSSSADLTTISSPDLSHKMTSGSCLSLLPRRQSQHTMQEDDDTGLRNRSNSLTRVDVQPQGSMLTRRQRPLSQPVPCGLYLSLEGGGGSSSDGGDGLSLTRSMSKDSLASNVLSITPRHMLAPPPHLPPACRLNGLMMSNVRIEDEEEEVEEEELVAIIHPAALSRQSLEPYLEGDVEQDELDVPNGSASKSLSARRSPCRSPHSPRSPRLDVHLAYGAAPPSRPQAGAFYLEPLMPAVPKPAKEKRISLNKEEECGESFSRAPPSSGPRRAYADASGSAQRRAADSNNLRGHFTPIAKAESTFRPPAEGAVGPGPSALKQPPGFFLHVSREDLSQAAADRSGSGQICHGHIPTAWQGGNDSDSEIADLEDEEEELEDLEFMMDTRLEEEREEEEERGGEVESAKLKEDMKVCERDDKEGGSGRSSPSCLSTASWASSCSASGSAGVRMTSFAERKLHKIGSFRDGGGSSTSCSQKTTPDGSESHLLGGPLKGDGGGGGLLLGWQAKEPGVIFGKTPGLPSELVQLHMQLEEQRRAIEHQKKKTEALSARQRQKLGKAAFLNIVKKGGGRCDTLPQPLKHSPDLVAMAAANNRTKAPAPCKDDSWLDELRLRGKAGRTRTGGNGRSNVTDNATFQDGEAEAEPDLNNCNRSIEVLNDAISSIQQQIMQLSLQQDQMMKQSLTPSPSGPPPPAFPTAAQLVSSPPPLASSGSAPVELPAPPGSTKCTAAPRAAVHFVELGGTGSVPARRPPKLSSGQRSPRTKPSQLKLVQDNSRGLSAKPSPLTDTDTSSEINSDQRGQPGKGWRCSPDSTRFQDDPVGVFAGDSTEMMENSLNSSGGREVVGDDEESTRVKGQLIEVDLKHTPEERLPDSSGDGEQKNGLGFFFKDEMKMAEDEMAKRRQAFILKQQRKAEEARIRKQQQEGESELKRDEARRKAEEDRIRKEEEKARRELIKQEYLRRKQQELLEEQGLVQAQPRPRPRTKSRKIRPKSLHRGDSSSLSKGSTRHSLMASMLTKAQGSATGCRGADLSRSYQGSTLSLATEADSVTSGGADSQRAGSVCSVESFPMLSRASSRNLERDWENGSTASSLTLAAEYNGPKLFKEPSSKSNKLIIINAIAHCCLAGKVNEAQKTVILEELEKCESNHLLILFRDGGCQFRAVYAASADGEDIVKFTGTGPRTIGPGMIEKLYKYSSGRKQFTVIPTKTVSVSVDAMTIHNHLWHVKRPGSARRKAKHDPGAQLLLPPSC